MAICTKNKANILMEKYNSSCIIRDVMKNVGTFAINK